jgi:hypothetical protein
VGYIDKSTSPLYSIYRIIRENAPVSAIHIFSQGKPGTLVFANDKVNVENIEDHEEMLGAWKEHFAPHGDILLYGCEVGKGSDGIHFVRNFAMMTGLDVAASDNSTGSVFKGGDWFFEVKSGRIESRMVVSRRIVDEYPVVLGSVARNRKGLDLAYNVD